VPQLPVSIILPTYNRAHLIERAIKSALINMEPGDELIVVDDESTDNTREVLKPYDERLRYFYIKNQGAGAARNFGIEQARFPLAAFLDSDDEWFEHKLYFQRRLMEARPEVLFCFSNFAVTDIAGKEHRRHLVSWNDDHRHWDEILGPGGMISEITQLPEGIPDFRFHVGDIGPMEMQNPYILTSTMIARREEAGRNLRFAEDLPTYEDLECFGKLSLAGKAAYLDTETAWQHGHSGERLTDHLGITSMRANLVILERVWGRDRKFLETHRQAYQATVEQLRTELTESLIVHGKIQQARVELDQLRRPPWRLKLLTNLPGWVVRAGLGLRRLLLGKSPGSFRP
jgi:hypothetical protein